MFLCVVIRHLSALFRIIEILKHFVWTLKYIEAGFELRFQKNGLFIKSSAAKDAAMHCGG